MPGPTGETNQLSAHPRGVVLCLGPGSMKALSQAQPQQLQAYRVALAERQVKLIPLVCEDGLFERIIVERHYMHQHHDRGR